MILEAVVAGSWLAYSVTGMLGFGLSWVTLRLNSSLVWRNNAEGYKAELERQKAEHDEQVSELNRRLTILASRIHEQDEIIRKLQERTDVVPLLELSKDIKDILVNRTALFDGQREILDELRTAEAERKRENEALFADLRANIFPTIEAIHRIALEHQLAQLKQKEST